MEATKITKIEFDSPIVLHEGEQLVTVFMNTPTELKCRCILVQRDGTKVPIGENVEDVLEPSGEPNNGNNDRNQSDNESQPAEAGPGAASS